MPPRPPPPIQVELAAGEVVHMDRQECRLEEVRVWREYERRKRDIRRIARTPEEYEALVMALAEELGI